MYSEANDLCWRWHESRGDMQHIFWSCKKIQSFWLEVFQEITVHLKLPLNYTIVTCLLHLGINGKYLVLISNLLIAAKLLEICKCSINSGMAAKVQLWTSCRPLMAAWIVRVNQWSISGKTGLCLWTIGGSEWAKKTWHLKCWISCRKYNLPFCNHWICSHIPLNMVARFCWQDEPWQSKYKEAEIRDFLSLLGKVVFSCINCSFYCHLILFSIV